MKNTLRICLGVTFFLFVSVNVCLSALKNKDKKANMKMLTLECLAMGEGTDTGEGGGGNYSCTVTVECGFPLSGSVSCSGKKCSRGLDWLNGAYVECDGNKTYC